MRLLLTLALALLAAPAFAATSYLVTQTTITISESNVCKKVSAPTGTRYISTKTASEWSSFYTNPNGLNVASCCAGGSVGGYCWYFGAAAQSCDTVCATHGGCNATGTVNYAGSAGALANCNSVGQALNPGAAATDSTSTSGVGCYASGLNGHVINHRITNTATTCAASSSSLLRFCACNN